MKTSCEENLRNIEKAAQAILDGVEEGKTFYVHYDVDVDGCTAGSIAARYLEYLGADVYIGINHKKEHGIEAVVLGCTELPLLLNDDNCVLPCMDSVAIHIQELINASTE